MNEKKKRSKYGAKKIRLDGFVFDSKRESRRYAGLKMLERAGKIESLKVHSLLPIIWDQDGIKTKICDVEADFDYLEKVKSYNDFVHVFEDCKGMDTPMSRLKRKLVEAAYPGIDWRVLKS